MKINTFKINLGNASCGWMNISIFNNGILSISMSGTSVFNPLEELPTLLKDLSLNKNVEWEVDQEGYDGLIKFKQIGRGLIQVTTEDLRDNPQYYETINIYSKKQVIKEFITKLIEFEKENKEEMIDEYYDFNFDIEKIKKMSRFTK